MKNITRNLLTLLLITPMLTPGANAAISSTDMILEVALKTCGTDISCVKLVKTKLTAEKSRLTNKFTKPATASESVAAVQCAVKFKTPGEQDQCMSSFGFVIDKNK
jgi:hypothetical protein